MQGAYLVRLQYVFYYVVSPIRVLNSSRRSIVTPWYFAPGWRTGRCLSRRFRSAWFLCFFFSPPTRKHCSGFVSVNYSISRAVFRSNGYFRVFSSERICRGDGRSEAVTRHDRRAPSVGFFRRTYHTYHVRGQRSAANRTNYDRRVRNVTQSRPQRYCRPYRFYFRMLCGWYVSGYHLIFLVFYTDNTWIVVVRRDLRVFDRRTLLFIRHARCFFDSDCLLIIRFADVIPIVGLKLCAVRNLKACYMPTGYNISRPILFEGVLIVFPAFPKRSRQ